MEKSKLIKILEFNKEHNQKIHDACMRFYDMGCGRESSVISDIQSLAKILFESKGYQFLHIPMKNKEIGAFQLKLNEANYLVLNSSKSVANNNFAVAHEIYHVLIQEQEGIDSVEVYMDCYEDNEDEMMANAFAGNIIMPKRDFLWAAGMIRKKLELVDQGDLEQIPVDDLVTILHLMNLFKTTYMSVVIRCYELGIFDVKNESQMDFLLKINNEIEQRKYFGKLEELFGFSIMEPTYADDFKKLYEEAKRIGKKNLERGAITGVDLKYRLEGMEKAYLTIVEKRNDH